VALLLTPHYRWGHCEQLTGINCDGILYEEMSLTHKTNNGEKMIEVLLQELNERLVASHTVYEDHYWTSHMGDHSVDEDLVTAQGAVDAFRADRDLSARVNTALETAEGRCAEKLLQWQTFFSCYQVPEELLALRSEISELETEVGKARANRKEGYTDPVTGKFVKASLGKMRMMMNVNDDEAVRRACFEAIEKFSVMDVAALIKLVNLRNEYARALGDEDFYAYKLRIAEGMTKEELFTLCDEVYDRTRYGFDNLREMEQGQPGIRLPWNKDYMLAGDLTQRKDPYLQFSDALIRWGRSFAALGIDFQGATLELDLIDREGKYNNGFCHYPVPVHFIDGKRVPGKCNFTSNSVPGQVGDGAIATLTLFHEGGHAAHLTNVETTETCMNQEYAPMSVSLAETHSMFLDTMQSSIEWRTRYAKDASGEAYPFEDYEEAVHKLHPVKPLCFMRVLIVVDFERELYSTPDLTEEKVIEMALRSSRKHSDLEVDSAFVLKIPHIYSWDSSCYYHGYGLATLTLSQWREYFYTKYGHIVDNPEVGREMYEVWKLGASKTFAEFVELATGERLSAKAFIANVTRSVDETLALARERIASLESVPEHTGPVDLNAIIRMVDGKNVIADNSQGFEEMADIYQQWMLSKEPGEQAA